MKKWTIILILFLVVGCTKGTALKKEAVPSESKKDSLTEEVEKKIESMSLEEKLGQMLFISYRFPTFDDYIQELLEEVKPGGFILFKENFTTYDGSLTFIKNVKKTSTIPLFLGIDQEGGSVQRLSSLEDMRVSKIPRMYDVGSKNDESLTKSVAQVVAEELRVFGINLDFAPTIDIYSNPNNTVIGKRAFGSNRDVVSKMGYAFGKGLEESGIIPVYKHFPGHGDTSTDSHYTLPIVYKDLPSLQNFELVPFQHVIDNGASMIMVGHLALPNVTGDNTPASLSKILITDILRNQMGFKGIVITDAMNMQALSKNYKEAEIYEKALLAGVDIFLMPQNPKEAIRVMKDCLDRGVITEKQIDNSVAKILVLKYKKIRNNYDIYLPNSYLNSMEHQAILTQI